MRKTLSHLTCHSLCRVTLTCTQAAGTRIRSARRAGCWRCCWRRRRCRAPPRPRHSRGSCCRPATPCAATRRRRASCKVNASTPTCTQRRGVWCICRCMHIACMLMHTAWHRCTASGTRPLWASPSHCCTHCCCRCLRHTLLSATYFLTPTLFLCLTCNLLLKNYCCTDHSLHTHCCMPAAAVCAAADRR
jgi:hypothetical protein